MIPYLLLLLFVVVVSYVGRRSGSYGVRRISLFVVGAALVLFAGLRDRRIGTDTGTYIRHFHASESIDIVGERQDWGYYLLSWFARTLSESYAVLLLLIAVVVVVCYMTTITRVVRRYETAIYLFVALSVYTFFFNGARQGIAAAICFLALPFLLERRLWPYIALIAVAATFHRTALIALPLYWLASPQVGWRRLSGIGVATAATVAFLGVFVGLAAELLSDRYARYADAGEGGGEVWVAYLVGQGAMLYWFKSIVPDRNGWYARLLNIYLVGLVPAVASTLSSVDPSGILRLHLYFSPVAILLWPMVFERLGTTPLRGLLALGFGGVTFAFFFLTTSTFSGLAPYRLNTSIFAW
ncbi:EpsG family protein [Luteimonas sp. MC1750]|uniref:EpsG family protein n=1 Tax=Luteimonas sp. MC1750 TaxID=2799326 RepID=UPI0018F0D92E|nr:EpsG family protein [Luteimonas sp. MC1750]MBJ6984218.1 EpsG family protein [Luteimonas sp. MC1750]QQO06995.1 EpsG family protein [Luteimonas sp. MC1750]